MSLPLPDEKRGCHRTGFEKKCRALVVEGTCPRWRNIPFFKPSTGEQIERWGCADDLGLDMAIENAAQLDGMRLEYNRMRNQLAEAHATNVGTIAGLAAAIDAMDQKTNAIRGLAPPMEAPRLLEHQHQ
jgi:hypothetical protein